MQRQFRETNAQNKTEIKIGGEKLLVTTLPFPYGILDSMIDDSLLFFFLSFYNSLRSFFFVIPFLSEAQLSKSIFDFMEYLKSFEFSKFKRQFF